MSQSKGIGRFLEKSKNHKSDPGIQKEILKNLVTAKILELMENKKIKKVDLAKLMHTSAANITQVLNGRRNLTLDTLCEIALALDSHVEVKFRDIEEDFMCKYYKFNTMFASSGEQYEISELDATLSIGGAFESARSIS